MSARRPRARHLHEVTARIDGIAARLTPQNKYRYGNRYASNDAASDPESIDCDNPEASGIGRTPARADMSLRAMSITSHLAAERRGVLVGLRVPLALVGAFLEHMSAETAGEMFDIASRTARAIVEDERPRPIAEVIADVTKEENRKP